MRRLAAFGLLGVSMGLTVPAVRALSAMVAHAAKRPVLFVKVRTLASAPAKPFGPPLPPLDKDPLDGQAAALTLAALANEELDAFTIALEELATRIESYVNPLGLDLGENDVQSEVSHFVRAHGPAFTAARWLLMKEWIVHTQAGDEEIVARLAASCSAPHGGDEVCVPVDGEVTGPSRTEQLERALFAAWPVSKAVWLRRPASGSLGAAKLRGLGTHAASTVALVLDRDTLAMAGQRGVSLAPIRAAATRIVQLLRKAELPAIALFHGLADATPILQRDLPPLGLQPGDTLVVPRLSALGKLSQFRREITDATTSSEPSAKTVQKKSM